MPDRPDVYPRVLRPLMGVLASLGIDPSTVLAAHGLRPTDLLDPHARITGRTLASVWAEATLRSGSPDIGLRTAELGSMMTLALGYGDVEFLAASVLRAAPSVGEGLTQVARALRATLPPLRTTIEPLARGRMRVALYLESEEPPPRQLLDFLIGWEVMPLARLTGMPFYPVAVDLPYPEPADTREHRRLLGPDVRFSRPGCAFVLTAAQWGLPNVAADPVVFATLVERVSELVEPIVGGLDDRVRALLRETAGRPPNVEQVAKALGLSPRTLARRLGEAGTSWRALLDEWQRERAGQLLARSGAAGTDRTMLQAASLLGYSSDRALRRAVRRWDRGQGAPDGDRGSDRDGGPDGHLGRDPAGEPGDLQ